MQGGINLDIDASLGTYPYKCSPGMSSQNIGPRYHAYLGFKYLKNINHGCLSNPPFSFMPLLGLQLLVLAIVHDIRRI